MEQLKNYKLIYLATPYSKFPRGLEHAFAETCTVVGGLIRKGVNVYSPIAHTHPVARYSNLDPLDHTIWLPFDQVMMAQSDLLLIATMDTWKESVGIHYEIDYFYSRGKDILFVDPNTLEITEFKRPKYE